MFPFFTRQKEGEGQTEGARGLGCETRRRGGDGDGSILESSSSPSVVTERVSCFFPYCATREEGVAQNQPSEQPTSIIDSKSLSNFDRKPPMNADAVGLSVCRPLGHYKSLHHRVIIPRTSAVREGKEEDGRGGARRGEAVPCLTNWYLMPDKCGTWCPMNAAIEIVSPASLF